MVFQDFTGTYSRWKQCPIGSRPKHRQWIKMKTSLLAQDSLHRKALILECESQRLMLQYMFKLHILDNARGDFTACSNAIALLSSKRCILVAIEFSLTEVSDTTKNGGTRMQRMGTNQVTAVLPSKLQCTDSWCGDVMEGSRASRYNSPAYESRLLIFTRIIAIDSIAPWRNLMRAFSGQDWQSIGWCGDQTNTWRCVQSWSR